MICISETSAASESQRTLAFTNCLIDGTALGGWHPRKLQRVNGSGTVEISTGGLWPGGAAFTTHYRHS